MSIPDRSTFENMYAGQPPWDIGRPQKAFIDVADQIAGSILDAGCGTGENALFFSSRGQKVTGIDFLAEPIRIAKQIATERGLTANFLRPTNAAARSRQLPRGFYGPRKRMRCSAR